MKTTENYGFKLPEGSDFYDIENQNENWRKTENELKKLADKKPTFEEAIMTAANWAENTYSFEAKYPNVDYDVEIQPNNTCNDEQLEAWMNAQLLGSAESNVLKAKVDAVPIIDIPIIIKAEKKGV